MIRNIQYFCPKSSIVLYNGGEDPELCEGLNLLVCPTSRKIVYGLQAIYLLEVMRWLEDINFDYDYLISLDSDALFARRGFEEFLFNYMEGKDYLGVDAGYRGEDWPTAKCAKYEWEPWKNIFLSERFTNLGVFNVSQTFSRQLVKKILSFEEIGTVEKNLNETTIWSIEELVFVNLVKRLGVGIHTYPRDPHFTPETHDAYDGITIRYRPHFTKEEIIHCINDPLYSTCYLFHPIHREMSDGARSFIRSLLKE
ncbi:hypothetical protein [Neobacillus sp. Marseille-QA0830]